MFSKLKQFKDLRHEAKILQNALSKEEIELENHGIRMKMNGAMELTNFSISTEWLTPEKKKKLEENIISLHQDLIKKVQKKAAEVMKATGGLENLKLHF